MKKFILSTIFAMTVFNSNIKASNSYFLKQVASGIIIGAISGAAYQKNNSELPAPLFLGGGLISFKFFYDVLTSQGSGDFFKSIFSVPLITGVAAVTGVAVGSMK